MKKFLILCLTFSFFLPVVKTEAWVRYGDKHPKKNIEISVAGFLNYEPLGFVVSDERRNYWHFFTVWQPMIDQIQKENNLKIKYPMRNKSYADLVAQVRGGKIDLLLGAYSKSDLYKGLEFIFPAILNNPVTIFMLPNRINEVSDPEDLKKLKGVRCSQEIYSDFVEQKLSEYSIEKVDKPYDMFERLFTKKADYILAGQYFGLIEAYKLGLRDQISISKQSLWTMPLFIAVSKASRHRGKLTQKLTHYAQDPKNQEIIKENLLKMIKEVEEQSIGTVPPTFGLEKTEE